MRGSIDAGSAVELALALRAFDAFAELGSPELAVLAENVRLRRFRRGAPLYPSGPNLRSIHFILTGTVGVDRDDRIVSKLRSGSVVGGMAALTREPEPRRYRALESTTTLELACEDLEDVFDDHLPIFLGIVRSTARAIVEVRSGLGSSAGYPRVERQASSPHPLGLVEKILVLREALGFADNRIEALGELAEEADESRLATGTALWALGDDADHLLVPARGVLGCRTANGAQRFELGSGALAGGLDALGFLPRWYAARAETELVALSIRRDQVIDIIEDDIELGIELLRSLAGELRRLLERAEDSPRVISA